MATRIEIELTSRRDDATFTWRAAGAREPKGVADAALFPAGSSVGEQFRVEADFDLEGITVTNVLPKEEKKKSPFDTLELLSRDDEPLVTQQLADKGRRNDRDRGERRGGRGKRRDGERGDGERGARGEGGGREGGRREGGERGERGRRGGTERPRTPAKPKLPPKPKPPRLKAGRTHRDELLASLPEEQKAVAQELLRGGLQAVRTALAKQNEQHKTEGAPEIDEGPILALAEDLLVKVRFAEWRDRAEAALEQAEVVDVRDLRTVVTAAEGMGRDDETRALAARLRTALNERLDAEHNGWVNEIIELLDDDRVVRALHLSSRPPKAGAPLPAPVAVRLVEGANLSMTSEITPDRWGYILEALAHSPVRRQVVPASLPATVTPELKTIIARFGRQLPEIAEIFGIEPDPRAGRGTERRRRKPKGGKKPDQAKADAGEQKADGGEQKADAPRDERASTDAAQDAASQTETVKTDVPPADAPPADASPQAEASQAEVPPVEAPQTDSAQAETLPQAEAPQADAPQAEAPQVEASQADATTDADGPKPDAAEVAAAGDQAATPADAPMADRPQEPAPDSPAPEGDDRGSAGEQLSGTEGPSDGDGAPAAEPSSPSTDDAERAAEG
jgi:hypothetical protein